MTHSALIVPISLNALHLAAPETVTCAKADFSLLPWSNHSDDFWPSNPYLADTILSTPLQNQTLTLSSGTHLHWTLPRALRTSSAASTSQSRIAFPAAPNRWLISRRINGSSAITQWIVESDFMSAATSTYNMDAITVPVHQAATAIDDSTQQPFMYLGRQLPLSDWLNEQSQKTNTRRYWPQIQGSPLTAMGYGELAFSTQYPNCRSVFGFYDHEGPANANYEVLGWYASPQDDILTGINSPEELETLLQWSTTENTGTNNTTNNTANNTTNNTPNTSLYFGTISTSSSSKNSTTASANPPSIQQIAIGNTGTEAVSAYLAHTLSASDKATIEDQLEAVLMGLATTGAAIDAGPNFDENRHERGFSSEDAGIQWTLRALPLGGNSTGEASQAIDLPPNISGYLSTLNQAQETYEQLQAALAQSCFQLYSDWYKYMLACYPPLGDKENLPNVDELQQYIKRTSLVSTQQLSEIVGVLTLQTTQTAPQAAPTTQATTASAKANAANTPKITLQANKNNTMAANVVAAFNTLMDALTSTNKALATSGYQLEIGYLSAPRYYAPNDPVLLFAGEATNTIEQEEISSDTLTCLLTPLSAINASPANSGLPYNLQNISTLASAASNAKAYQSTPGLWRPQTLEWLVEFFPVGNGCNVSSADGNYQTDYITQNFALNEDRFDFTQSGAPQKIACEYRGQTYVTASASTRYQAALKNYLLSLYPKLDANNFNASLKSIWTLYPDATQHYSNPGYTAVQAYLALNSAFILTQSLGGFNQAMLQHVNKLTLPVADPLGFTPYQRFSQDVATALQNAYTAAPDPNALFMPIRAGELSVAQLCITDQFGRTNQAPVQQPIPAETLAVPLDPYRCWLRPRLAQAARLRFRWLAATTPSDGDALETNSDPASTPICGWLMANYVDNSLVCYDSAGNGLGSFNELGQWQPLPGDPAPLTQSALTPTNPAALNPHLLKLLIYLRTTIAANSSAANSSAVNSTFIPNLISAFQSAQANIAPQNQAGANAIALLMGKPIAVVRAQLNLEAKGGLYCDQGWVALRANLQQGRSSTDDYENVTFPVRLGEYRQLDDGLIGYFVEHGGEYQNQTFYVNDSITAAYDTGSYNTSAISAALTATKNGTTGASGAGTDATTSSITSFLNAKNGLVKRQDFANQFNNGGAIFDALLAAKLLTRTTPNDRAIDYYANTGLLQQSLGGEPSTLTLLMDPRGVVHATTGILPVKTIQIPASYYTNALQKLAITFFTAPLLSPSNPLQLSLPANPGYQWSWLSQPVAGQWQRRMDTPNGGITPFTPVVDLTEQQILHEGWAQLTPAAATPSTTPTATTPTSTTPTATAPTSTVPTSTTR